MTSISTSGVHPKTGGAALGALVAAFAAAVLNALGVHIPSDVSATGGALLAALGAVVAPSGITAANPPTEAPAAGSGAPGGSSGAANATAGSAVL